MLLPTVGQEKCWTDKCKTTVLKWVPVGVFGRNTTTPYLLAAGLPDLFHLIIFALDLLWVGLTQTLCLHLQTQLGLTEEHKDRKLHFHRGSKEHFQRWFFNLTPIYYSEMFTCLQYLLVFALLLINSDICSCWKMREWGWGDRFCFLCLRPLLHLRLGLKTGLNVQKANVRHIVTSHFISGCRKCWRCWHQPAGSGKRK